MLIGVPPGAIIFTNGDNDTFPLWYIQEVENVRKDVRVVNLSLLQTQWYIRQLRDYEPEVDLMWDDATIDAVRPYIGQDGEVVWVNDICVERIIDIYYGKRPIYIAVTVPDLRGLNNRLMQEGLVFSVREPGESGVDVEKTNHNLGSLFSYRGLLDESGNHDTSIFKDKTASKLVQNYASGWVGIAHRYIQRGGDGENRTRALEALQKARNISPTYPGTSYTLGVLYYRMEKYAEAESTFATLAEQGEADVQVYRLLGLSQEAQNKSLDALRSYEMALNLDQTDRESYVNLFQFLVSIDQPQAALEVLDRWLQYKPDDSAFLDARRIVVESLESSGVMPPIR